jgi:hypothetical protein
VAPPIPIPADVRLWLSGVFANCNDRVASTLTQVPTIHEVPLDMTFIQHFLGVSTPRRFPSGWTVEISTHYLGGGRHYGEWGDWPGGWEVFCRVDGSRQVLHPPCQARWKACFRCPVCSSSRSSSAAAVAAGPLGLLHRGPVLGPLNQLLKIRPVLRRHCPEPRSRRRGIEAPFRIVLARNTLFDTAIPIQQQLLQPLGFGGLP